MNIFDQYGIKEVADVTLYSIELDENDDEVYVPVLYFDTLKVSTVEQTAEQVAARGGLGNPELIIWDYGKEITVTLEDALYSPASQGMNWAGKHGSKHIKLYGTLTDKRTGEPTAATLEVESYKGFSRPANTYFWEGANYKIVGKNGKRCRIENKMLGYNIETEEWGIAASGSQTGALTLQKEVADTNYNFVLSDEMNKQIIPPEEAIYQIDHALNNVYYLDRMEKCKASQTFVINTKSNDLHANYRYLQKYSQCELSVFIDPKTMQPYEPNTDEFTRRNGQTITGELRVIKQHEIYYKWTRSRAIENTSLGHQIIVDAVHFPGTYRLVGETFSRSRKTGKDHRYQFEIPLCKMGAENNLTLQADGDPTTFNMTLKVLRREDGVMMKLTQYSVEEAKYDGYVSGSTNVTPKAEVVTEDPTIGSD